MAYLVKAPRVGRSQGAVIFWGLVSAFFASAFCYYYLENRTNEEKNRTLVDQVMILQGERDSLNAERAKIEAAEGDTQKQYAERQEFLQEKEANLAQEEAQLEATGSQPPSQAQQNAAQAAVVKKFDDTAHQLAAQVPNSEVITRGGRPVMRLPSTFFFAPGYAQLKPESKSALDQLAQAVGGTSARFELRLATFTDSEGEASDSSTKPVDAWTLSAKRAAALSHYLRDTSVLPFDNVIATGRADFLPLGSAQDGRNRRVEITLAPIPAPFHAPEPKAASGKTASHKALPVTPANP